MKVKSVLYASVGAPVVAAKKVGNKANEVYGKLNEQASGYGEKGTKLVDDWAAEGEKTVVRVKDGKVVDEITSKVDLDQAKEQVGKLRDQLEDMLATWRTSFRPEKSGDEAKAASATEAPAKEASAKKEQTKPAAKKPAAKKPAANKASTSKTSTAKKTAAKESAEKSEKAS